MTSPKRESRRFIRIVMTGFAAAALAVNVAGCQKKKKPPPPPPPKPKAPPPPEPVDVNGVLQAMKPDARVQFPQSVAPVDRSLAEGVITLANDLAKGDAAALKPILTEPAQHVLDDLVASGGWAEGTKPIEQVRVVSLSNTSDSHPTDSTVGLAIQGKDGAYLLAWDAKRDGDKWVFTNSPCQGDVKPRASDFDGVSISADVSASSGSSSGSSSGASERPTTTTDSTPSSTKKPDKPEKPPSNPDNPGPIRKNTPAGPINIPRPPGSG